MINNDFSWFLKWFEKTLPTMERRPHALLLVGPKGIGKAEFALELAASLLCQSPLANRSACGVCAACNWMRALQHPDFRWLRPDADVEEEGGLAADGGAGDVEAGSGGGSAASGGEAESTDSKKKSQQIRIEQVRALAGFANVGSHRGGLRVVVISPANRMNREAANALLKTLEEPAESLMFILVADSLRGIPATIVSRCRRIDLTVDDTTLAKLQTQESQAAEWLLPLLAAGEVDPIRWAEKAGKSPPADALELMMRWMSDAARVANGVAPRSFPDQAASLSRQSLRIRSPQVWAQTMAELQRIRTVAEHPLNPKLFYESIFDRYRRALA